MLYQRPANPDGYLVLQCGGTELTASGTVNGMPKTVTAEVLQLTAATLQIRTTTTTTQSGLVITATATTTYAAF
ncbi:hypothetical protein GCM10022408_22020 [Hymenobacter fastidiosus]|uniref:Uncharacterized protein n=1 Tax=Hymenobacter fastidiosus TaxID=486264 RepID=A0ABP7SBT2_9BACT